jgi:hypothetical protein
MKGIARAFAAGMALSAVALAPMTEARAGTKTSNVKIVNKSQWSIDRLYLSPTDTDAWGPDQLADAVIEPNKSFTLNKIPCDTFDVKLVDEDGDECVVPDVDLCKSNETWEITSKDLLKCQAASE